MKKITDFFKNKAFFDGSKLVLSVTVLILLALPLLATATSDSVQSAVEHVQEMSVGIVAEEASENNMEEALSEEVSSNSTVETATEETATEEASDGNAAEAATEEVAANEEISPSDGYIGIVPF
ncbi:MAG: hypothetical protein FWC81_03805, partial [Coriobacteriia bacterium]|nr:hypothetical protein [Coriobacteriia bacterium]